MPSALLWAPLSPRPSFLVCLSEVSVHTMYTGLLPLPRRDHGGRAVSSKLPTLPGVRPGEWTLLGNSFLCSLTWMGRGADSNLDITHTQFPLLCKSWRDQRRGQMTAVTRSVPIYHCYHQEQRPCSQSGFFLGSLNLLECLWAGFEPQRGFSLL